MKKNYKKLDISTYLLEDDVVRCSGGGKNDKDLTEAAAEAAKWMHLAHITKPNDKNKK